MSPTPEHSHPRGINVADAVRGLGFEDGGRGGAGAGAGAGAGMANGLRAWLLRRDPGLLAVRRAGRVAAAAWLGFYVCYYLLNQPVMATYALFTTVAMGFLSQIPGSSARRCLVLLRALPVALALVTIGTFLAGDVWVAAAGVFVFGFVVAYSGVASPSLAGLSTGMQLFVILACFPPYALDTLGARLIGVCVGMGLLVAAERTLWPDRDAAGYATQLANACHGLATFLAARAAGHGSTAPLPLPDWPAEGLWPPSLPPDARPTSADRRDQALRDAGGALSFALARLRRMPSGTGAPALAPELLHKAAHTASSAADALRGGPPPNTHELTGALHAARHSRTELSVALAGVWIMAMAVRIAVGAPIESGHRRRFPYAYASTVGLWARRYRVHLTPRSVYFQAAVRVAVALAAARLIAGSLDLSHGFWVLLATLTLLRSRAADTRSALRPAIVGTVAGAAVVGALLVLVGARPEVYAAITPPIMVVAFAAGAIIGPTWGQALFTVLVTLVFTQLAPAGAELAGVRVVDVLIGAATGITAGLLTWPRGAGEELRRSTARFLAAGGRAVRATAVVLTQASPGESPPKVGEAMALADAAYTLYQTEHRRPSEPGVDWPALISTGHHLVRGSGLMLDLYAPGSLAQWQAWVTDSAGKVDAACRDVATTLHDRHQSPIAPPVFEPAPDEPDLDAVQAWLMDIADELSDLTEPANLTEPTELTGQSRK